MTMYACSICGKTHDSSEPACPQKIDIDKRNPMWANILSTYKCLLDACTKMPGMKMEDVFSPDAIQMIKDEFEWLKRELGKEDFGGE